MNGTVALVTGASRGIGRATAVRLAAAGADVILNYDSSADASAPGDVEETLALITRHGARTMAVDADASDRAAASRMVSDAEARFGRIDVLVNNAGIERSDALNAITEHDWDDTFAVNLKDQFLIIQAIASGKRARGAGKIVNVSSELALVLPAAWPWTEALKAAFEKLKTLPPATG